MIKFHDVTKENIKQHNPSWPELLNHPYRILITGGRIRKNKFII